MENDKPAKLTVDMEKVVGRFVHRAAEHDAYKDMPIKDFVRLVELYDEAYVNIILEHYRNMDQMEEEWRKKFGVLWMDTSEPDSEPNEPDETDRPMTDPEQDHYPEE